MKEPTPPSQGSAKGTNASLWITGLSPKVTYHTLLRSIKKVGRVKQTHINRPNQKNPNFCAAKITFFSRNAAQKLLDQAEKGEFKVDDIVPTVSWNKYARAEEPINGHSRVLRIVGPQEIVNIAFLEAFWARSFYWDTDRFSNCGDVRDGAHVIWYYFASWGGQASTARDTLVRCFGDRVVVTYERDTCGEG